MSSKCSEPRPKKTGARTQFAFLGRSAAGRRMTAEDVLEQLSGSGHSNMLALRRTSSNHFYVIGPENYGVRRNNANYMAITPFMVIQGHRFWYQSKAPISD